MQRIRLFVLWVLSAFVISAWSQRVLMVDIDEDIDATAWRNISRAMQDIRDAEPPFNLLLIKLNTYGGAVDMADSIRTALMKSDVPTVAFIDHNAASAGALIALSCDSAFMAPGSSIGAATVVNGQGEPMPVKYQSYWSTVMRSTAAAHGKYIKEGDSVPTWRRNPDIAADMVNPDKAVSYTTDEALQLGLIDGVAESPREILDRLDMPDAEITVFEPTFTDRLMGFFASTGVRAILIMLILGGLYMEMHTAGMGFAGAVSVVAAVLYFMPMVVGGTLAPWVVILFLIGIVALALEIFVIPGFGVAGVAGIICIIFSLLGAMIHYDSFNNIDMDMIWAPVCTLVAGALLAIIAVLFLTSKYGPKKLQRIAALTTQLSDKDGFVGVDMSPESLIGKEAKAMTDLRPAGKVLYKDKVYDATSTGEFIHRHSQVRIVRYEAAQIYVEPLKLK